MRTTRMRVFFLAGSVLSIVLVAACSDAFWDDPSLSLRSGLGDDPVLDLVFEEGNVVSRTGEVVTDGRWSQHPSHIALTRGDVFDVREVMPDTTRGATIAFRLDVSVESEFPGDSDDINLCLISTVYRPGSPVRFTFVIPVDASGTSSSADTITIEEWSLGAFNASYGHCSAEGSWCWDVPSASGSSFDPYGDATSLAFHAPRWAAVTLDRNGGGSFYLEGAFLQNTSMWDLTEFSREFGALALIPSVSCHNGAEWMRETEFDPVQNPIEPAGASSPFTFEISAIRVFDYALTNEQLERLPDF